MKLERLASLMSATAAIAAFVNGCGGGGGGSTPAPAPPATVNVSTTVIDGAIQNATVCLDKNNNGACDPGEPSGTTAADGSVVLTVLATDAGLHPLLAVVGTDAVDADTGPVATRYVLKAPADSVAVISPLTTLVQQVVESAKVTSAVAEKIIQDQSGLTTSLFTNYTAGSSANPAAALIARTFVVTTQLHAAALASTIGNAVPGGGTISQVDIDNAVRDAMAEVLPDLVTAAANSTVQAACAGAVGSQACKDAIAAQAGALASQTGLSPITIAAAVGVAKQLAGAVADPNATPTEGGSLDFARFGDANNWSYQIFVSTAQENTPDSSGLTRFRDVRRQMVGGVLTEWTFSGDPTRKDDTHWNGTAWVNCPFGFQSTSTVRDAQGHNSSNYCDSYQKSTNQRIDVDISGQLMSDVVNTIRTYPSTARAYPQWGTAPAGFSGASTFNPGTNTFPAGSKLRYQTNTPTEYAYTYDVRANNVVRHWSAGLAAGGDARGVVGHPCTSAEANSGATINPGTLENMILAFPGSPCLRTPGSITSGATVFPEPPDPTTGASIAWQYTSLGIGTLGTVNINSTPTGFFTGNTSIRFAFTGSGVNPVTYYACQQVFISGGIRQCTTIGTGSYTITTLGDARVMTLNNPPLLAAGLNFSRVLVERSGSVYFGFQNKLTQSKLLRLNLTAANAIFAVAGVPEVSTVPSCSACTGKTFAPLSAAMTTTRALHRATLLDNGQVLLTGGILDSTLVALSSAELYNPATNTFTPIVATMTSPRNQHQATKLPNGKVLITGGSNNINGDGLNTAELFDPVAQTFTPLAATMVSPRGAHTATLLGNGKVLLAGGFYGPQPILTDAELYDTATGAFTAVPGTMRVQRDTHAAALLFDGRVLLTGGDSGASGISTAEVYSPATNAFTLLVPTMTIPRSGHSATSLPNGQVLIVGGAVNPSPTNVSAFNSAEVYDPVGNTFAGLTATLTTSRYGHAATVLPNGTVLITGGGTGSNSVISVLNTAEVYGP